MTGRPKTGDELLKIIREDIAHMKAPEEEGGYGVKDVVGWVTDDGPDGKKARRRMSETELAYLMLLFCWAHQLNLVTGDMFRVMWVSQTMRDAVDVAVWFNNHGVALELLREEQLFTNPTLKTPLALIRPVQTRWTSHFHACTRLLQLQGDLRACVSRRASRLEESVGTDPEAVAKVRAIIAKIREESFWTKLKR